MNYAILNFNDKLYFKAEGIGLLPVVFKYQGLTDLYFKKLAIQSNYTLSSIRDLEADSLFTSQQTEEIYEEKRECEMKIHKYMEEHNIPRKVAVVQIGEEDGQIIVKELTTGAVLYVSPQVFSNHIVSEIDAKNLISLEEEEKLKTLRQSFQKNFKNRR